VNSFFKSRTTWRYARLRASTSVRGTPHNGRGIEKRLTGRGAQDLGSNPSSVQSRNNTTFLPVRYRRETVFLNAAANISACPIFSGAPSQTICLGVAFACVGPKPWPDIYRGPRNERMIVRALALAAAKSSTWFITGLQTLLRAPSGNVSVS